MYSIAICDDEEIVCNQFERALEPYILGKKIDLDVFYKGEKLVEALSEGQHFDLIFLDIELYIMNGVEVGKYIRDKLENEDVQIVYISAKQQYAMELFETRPMNFLVKPISAGIIIETVEKAMRLDRNNNKCFELKRGAEMIRLPYGEIRYFESNNRKVIVHAGREQFEIYGKLNSIESKLPVGFIRIHQSYLVNSKYIDYWRIDRVHVRNLKELPISQGYRKQVAYFLLSGEGEAVR